MTNAWAGRLRDDAVVLDSLPDSMQKSLDERRQFVRSLRAEPGELEFLVSDLQRWRPGENVTVAFLGGDKDLHRDIAEATRPITDVCSITLDFGHDEATGEYRKWSTDDKSYTADVRVGFAMD